MKKNLFFSGKGFISAMMLVSFALVTPLLNSCSKEEMVTPAAVNNDVAGSSDRMAPPVASIATSVNNRNVVVPSEAIIYISHSRCMGFCPAYSVMVSCNNKVTYTGISNVGTIGTVEYTVPQHEITRLITLMLRERFFQMRSDYPFIGDAPQNVTALQLGPFRKVIVDYGIDIPQEFIDLRNVIEANLGVSRLINGPIVNANGIASTK